MRERTALIVINKDNSLDVTVREQTYTLKFTREIMKKQLLKLKMDLGLGNVVRLICGVGVLH